MDAFYENRSFYVLTHELTNKMKHIRNNPDIAIAGDWFTANGRGIDLGYFGRKENERIALKIRELFSAWIDNGHKGISKNQF